MHEGKFSVSDVDVAMLPISELEQTWLQSFHLQPLCHSISVAISQSPSLSVTVSLCISYD